MPRIVPYIRVSTDEQAQSGLGLEAQVEAIRKSAEVRGLPQSDPFVDPGVPGDTPLDKRKGLTAALAALKRGDILMVAKLDRLSRDGAAETQELENAIKRRGARLISAAGEGTEPKGKYDSSAHNQKEMTLFFSRVEKRAIGERTYNAMRSQRGGLRRTGQVPFGFREVPDPPRLTKRKQPAFRLEPLPDEQATVAEIVRLRNSGLGLRAICRALEKQGRKARQRLTKAGNHTGARWHPETVRSILGQVRDFPDQFVAHRPLGEHAPAAAAAKNTPDDPNTLVDRDETNQPRTPTDSTGGPS